MAKKKKSDWTTVNLIILGLGLMMYVNKRKAMENPFASWGDYPAAGKKKKATIEEGRYWIATLKSGEEIAMDSTALKKAIDSNRVKKYREI